MVAEKYEEAASTCNDRKKFPTFSGRYNGLPQAPLHGRRIPRSMVERPHHSRVSYPLVNHEHM